MSAITSDRLRSFLLWLSHHPFAVMLPMTALGALHLVGWPPAPWAVTVAGIATVVLAPAAFAAERMHRPLDDAGLPCRHCDVTAEDVDGGWAA